MSRAGKTSIKVPEHIHLKTEDRNLVFSKGNNSISLLVPNFLDHTHENGYLTFTPVSSEKKVRVHWGTIARNAQNIVTGLADGFVKTLIIKGVGYRASLSGKKLTLSLGYSHEVLYTVPDNVDIALEKNNTIILKSYDKKQLGDTASHIRSFRPPEPYNGKGIFYSDEKYFKKEGKKK